MGIKFEFSLLGRSHIHWGETGYQDVIVEVSYDDLAALALANGYVKLADDEIVVKLRSAHDPERARRKDMCHIEIDALAKSAGYIKLEPGQIVVSREAGKQIKACVGYYLYDEHGHCDSDSRCVDAYRELCAALEVKP